MPAQDMFWGDRYGVVTDPYGHKWSFAMSSSVRNGTTFSASQIHPGWGALSLPQTPFTLCSGRLRQRECGRRSLGQMSKWLKK